MTLRARLGRSASCALRRSSSARCVSAMDVRTCSNRSSYFILCGTQRTPAAHVAGRTVWGETWVFRPTAAIPVDADTSAAGRHAPGMDTPGIAIICHSCEGDAAAAAEHIASRARASGVPADVFECDQAPARLRHYSGLIVGGSIHFGRHHKELEQFVRARKKDLDHVPNGFFSVGLPAATHDRARRARALDAVSHLIAETGWHPDIVSLVGGAGPDTRYGFIKRRLPKKPGAGPAGPTAPREAQRYADWEALDRFTDDFLVHVRPARVPAGSYREGSSTASTGGSR
ncbi:MAG: hypothetical protein C0506_02745 [Anaerolinea sp.]|nr:hypothetical protein [Anaerolinea sp.]